MFVYTQDDIYPFWPSKAKLQLAKKGVKSENSNMPLPLDVS
jgi:hypothetical protein